MLVSSSVHTCPRLLALGSVARRVLPLSKRISVWSSM